MPGHPTAARAAGRERSLILRPWEVVAALAAAREGRIWQVRRSLKRQPPPDVPNGGGTRWISAVKISRSLPAELFQPVGDVGHIPMPMKMGIRCPLGAPGDVLVCKETWARNSDEDSTAIGYVADDAVLYFKDSQQVWPTWAKNERSWAAIRNGSEAWRSPAHMPRWAARLTMPVAEVRCERVQSATVEDAREMGLSIGADDPAEALEEARNEACRLWADDFAANAYQFIARGKPEVRK